MTPCDVEGRVSVMSLDRLRTAGFLAGCLLVVQFPGSGLAASAADLLPHRVAYDLSVLESDMGSDVSGRMVMEFSGATCEGFTTNFRFVLRFVDTENRVSVTDLRTTTFEAPDGRSFDFLSRTFDDQKLSSEVKGKAIREGGGVEVELTSPADASYSFSSETVFPVRNLQDLLVAAESGRTVIEARVFDGADDGDKVYETTSIIGARRSGDGAALAETLRGRAFWPVSVSYFDPAVTGDRVPEYGISFDLYDNGVSDNLVIDYGDLKLAGHMTNFEAMPATDCE
jgi:Domain of unknown function (DUF1849).